MQSIKMSKKLNPLILHFRSINVQKLLAEWQVLMESNFNPLSKLNLKIEMERVSFKMITKFPHV